MIDDIEPLTHEPSHRSDVDADDPDGAGKSGSDVVPSEYACDYPHSGYCTDLVGSDFNSDERWQLACLGGVAERGDCAGIYTGHELLGTCVYDQGTAREIQRQFYSTLVTCQMLGEMCAWKGGVWFGDYCD